MRTIQMLIFIFSIFNFILAQHTIPFASSNNEIELSIANASTVAASNVVVEVTSAPQWLRMSNSKYKIENIKEGETSLARFSFLVDKSAPVNKPEQITFTITNSDGQKWNKTISLQVSPPEEFELFQNFPNPFNPTTVISYQLPTASNITLKIFDAIGREVATLDEGVKEAGYHEVKWSAMNASSGMYIYQLAWKNEKGEQKYYRKKLLVMK